MRVWSDMRLSILRGSSIGVENVSMGVYTMMVQVGDVTSPQASCVIWSPINDVSISCSFVYDDQLILKHTPSLRRKGLRAPPTRVKRVGLCRQEDSRGALIRLANLCKCSLDLTMNTLR